MTLDSTGAGAGGGGGGGGGGGIGPFRLDAWPSEGEVPAEASAISSSRDVAASSLALRKHVSLEK